jgi:hypothetical protein
MQQKTIHSIVGNIIARKVDKGSYFILAGQLIFTDYNIRISYRNYLKTIQKLQTLEIENSSPGLGTPMEALTEAKFFFEAIYWFILAIEKIAKQKSEDEMIKAFRIIFKKYEYLKLPRVNISKDNFSKLIKAESTGDQKTITALTGDSKLMFQFSVDGSGYIKFQRENYDPHKYFRDYIKLLNELKSIMEKL